MSSSAELLTQDVNSASKVITFSTTSNTALNEIAVRQQALLTAISSNPALMDSKTWMESFLNGRIRYDAVVNYPGTTPRVAFDTHGLGNFYGQPGNIYGNIADWTLVNAGGSALYIAFAAGSTTWNISAAAGTVWSGGVTISAVESTTIRYHAERYAFLCQYMWSSPSMNPLSAAILTPTIPVSSIAGAKFGLYFTAQTYSAAATALTLDVDFYSRKQTFIGSML